MPVRRYMLLLCLAILSLSHQHSFGQGKADIQWTRFNLLWLDTVWKFKPGAAHPSDFTPSLNDSNWLRGSTYNPGLYGPPSFWPGVGVFRKHFPVPDSLRGKKMELLLQQMGASEIYIDGALISRVGIVGTDAAHEQLKRNSISVKSVQFQMDSQPSHVIAVYYSIHTDSSIMRRLGVIGIELSVIPYDPEAGGVSASVIHMTLSLGIILSFCLFFWFVYLFYPYRLASLFSALYLTSFTLIFLGGMLSGWSEDNLRLIIGDDLWRIGFCGNSGWNVLFLFSAYYSRMPKRAWIVGFLMVLTTLLSLFIDALPLTTILPVVILFDIEIVRMIILGLKKKKNGFGILAIGASVSFAGTVTAIFDPLDLFPWYLTTKQTVLAVITDLSFPLTLALHFAWEFGSANRDLRQQLITVKDLSVKTVAQEQEKQQILAEQNELLEKQVEERTNVVVIQKQEIEKQRDQATGMLDELRSAQKQLVQAEKMASLGELTAGIAHEIQNPLNFVNNFSELNSELIEDLNKEVDAGDFNEVKTIAGNLKENTAKITHHGRRAEAIVRGMLQHSRKNTGEKEVTDINMLAEEYLKLSYHGLRAKDKDFTATLETNFDEQAGKLTIVPQDIGRVLLNVFSNAFFAVGERKKQGASGFKPVVSVSTKKTQGTVQITVRDNGTGIPVNILDKIFQPFFTTKSAGQGTGLGLSLSYDIIKAHGGELSVKTQEGDGTIFTIDLPY